MHAGHNAPPLVVRADGDTLFITLTGAVDASAGRSIRDVSDAARRLGIPFRVDVVPDGEETRRSEG